MAEAVRGGWLELWYQPKIDTQAIIVGLRAHRLFHRR
jgi:hypothetical protein